ncbi:LOW QUALITY PROTEIN: 26S proteasome non-ATPase regulatory subunit 4-like [Rhynchonycteris naso]
MAQAAILLEQFHNRLSWIVDPASMSNRVQPYTDSVSSGLTRKFASEFGTNHATVFMGMTYLSPVFWETPLRHDQCCLSVEIPAFNHVSRCSQLQGSTPMCGPQNDITCSESIETRRLIVTETAGEAWRGERQTQAERKGLRTVDAGIAWQQDNALDMRTCFRPQPRDQLFRNGSFPLPSLLSMSDQVYGRVYKSFSSRQDLVALLIQLFQAPAPSASLVLVGVGGWDSSSWSGREEGGKTVLESTMVCVDNSEYMRNGDFLPTQLQAQQDAVNIVCHAKTYSNPENNVGLIALANYVGQRKGSDYEVLTTLTPDTRHILSKLHTVQPKGKITFCTGIRLAHLALKHQQGKNHKMHIIAFVGNPVEDNEKDLVKLAKRLKKKKVNVDIINFGKEEVNTEKLTAFVNTLNGKDGTGSHLVTVPPGPSLVDALISSLILTSEGRAMLGLGASDFEFGLDPSADPELALTLHVSMEEQWQRQQEEEARATAASAAEAGIAVTWTEDSDNALLKMTISQQFNCTGLPDLSSMTEEEQIACAMQMFLQGAEFGQAASADIDASSAMDTSEPAKEEDDYDVMQELKFLQSVLENLPGVDLTNEAILNAMGSLASQATKNGKKEKKKEDKK